MIVYRISTSRFTALNEPQAQPNPVPAAATLSHTQLCREGLLARIESRLTQIPAAIDLQVERAHLLADLNRPTEAARAYRDALKSGTPRYPVSSRAYSVLPYQGGALPLSVLLLVSPSWGNAPFRKYLDDQTFLTVQVISDFHDPGLVLPPHQLAINCISDADACESSLQAALRILTEARAPVINPPHEVLASGRESNARRFSALPNVRTPRIATFPREFFADEQIAEKLASKGFAFPLLLRAPGFHTGLHFLRVESAEDLTPAVAGLPGASLSVIEFLDARSADGLVRKYRVMVIDGKFYPAHVAVSPDWKVHFVTSGAPDLPAFRAEDRAFLENMSRVLGARSMETLSRIAEVVQLDYWGIDFSLGADGEIVLFEANATMNVSPPDPDEKWSYRRAPARQIAEAVRAMFIERALTSHNPTAAWPAHMSSEFALSQIEERLGREPERVDLQVERGRLLIELGRLDEAQEIYLKILIKDPTQFAALNNLGAVLKKMGHSKEALKLYRGAFALKPEDVTGRVNLAHSLREAGELEESRLHYEAVLRQVPYHSAAHNGLSHVLMYLGEEAAAWVHHEKGSEKNLSVTFPYAQGRQLLRILTLASACGGNSPITRFLDKENFSTVSLVPDFHNLSTPLPEHDLVINAIGDADHCGSSLRAAGPLLKKVTRPVLNLPDRIMTTGRADNARLLGTLEGVVTPKIAAFTRDSLAGPNGLSILEQHQFHFPILLRTPGFHEGSHFVRIESPDALATEAAKLPGPNLMAIEYLNARNEDGKIRKFRVMMIDGQLYPLHKAISREWMIHYFSAEMANSPAHRDEDLAFLQDMPSVLGPRAIGALERIRDSLGLDYAGADFSLGPNGEVLLFEANATMAIPLPDQGEKWDYRRPFVLKIHAAVREMIRSRARV